MIRICSQFFIIIVLAGCAQTRLYPICFYDNAPPKIIFEKQYAPQLEAVFRTSLNSSRVIEIALTPDARWLIAKTSNEENKQLAKIWPRIGCIGKSDIRESVIFETYCVAYVENFIVEQNYLKLGVHIASGGVTFPNEAPESKLLVYCNSAMPVKE
jgi:hypothetical protein